MKEMSELPNGMWMFCRTGSGSRVGPKNEALTVGMDKETAQRQFIEEAEDLGIPPISWQDSPTSETETLDQSSWKPKAQITDGRFGQFCPVSRRLSSRSLPATVSGGQSGSATLENANGSKSLYHGITLLARILVSLWTLWLQQPKSAAGGKVTGIERRHAREWNQAET
jgi:hypothetical protein